MEKNDFFIKRIRELANLSYQRDIVTFSDFLNLNEQSLVKMQSFAGVTVKTYGGYRDAERVIAAFYPATVAFSWHYPIQCLKAETRSHKFSETLSHRDYLGAVLNLGVDRAVIGDILVREDAAWIFCESKIADFLTENLIRVRHTAIAVTPADNLQELPEPQLTAVSGTCSSVRLDSLIALAFRASRSSMVSFIESGQVFVNGRQITSNGYEPGKGDIISVRGKGRFQYAGIAGQTKKGRISVRLFLYQ